MNKDRMACRPQTTEYYDLELLKKDQLPIDSWIRQVREAQKEELYPHRQENRVLPGLYDITPYLVDRLEKEGKRHIQKLKGNGYLYTLAENSLHLHNVPHFDYKSFPLIVGREGVLERITKMAKQEHKKILTLNFDATCLYLLYFYALLVNPKLNWITMDYLASGNRYHQWGTQLNGKFVMRAKMTFETT